MRYRQQQGQIIIEYILLLVVIVGLGAFILRAMVSRDEENPGFLIEQWSDVIKQIGEDDPSRY